MAQCFTKFIYGKSQTWLRIVILAWFKFLAPHVEVLGTNLPKSDLRIFFLLQEFLKEKIHIKPFVCQFSSTLIHYFLDLLICNEEFFGLFKEEVKDDIGDTVLLSLCLSIFLIYGKICVTKA
jgi:hypothetical protein